MIEFANHYLVFWVGNSQQQYNIKMDDYDYEDEEYLPEVTIFDRIGFEGSMESEKWQKKFHIRVKNILQEFGIVLGITQHQYQYLEDVAKNLPHNEYRNPFGFLLGFNLINRNGDISLTKVHQFPEMLRHASFPEDFLIEDAIRYARLWKSQIL